MTIELDPEWEYWDGGDQEIRAVLAEAALGRPCDRIDAFRVRHGYGIAYGGVRFGKGNPDYFLGRVGPAALRRPNRELERLLDYGSRRPAPVAKCPTCGLPKRSGRTSRVYCSLACVPRTGRARSLPDRECRRCGVAFRPWQSEQRFCSKECGHSSSRIVDRAAASGKAAGTEGRCRVCRSPLPPPYRGQPRLYCSRGCRRCADNLKQRLRRKDLER